MRIIKIFFLLSVVLGACSEEQMLPGEGATSPEATFRLHEAEYSGDAGSGRYAAGGIVRSISGAAGYKTVGVSGTVQVKDGDDTSIRLGGYSSVVYKIAQ